MPDNIPVKVELKKEIGVLQGCSIVMGIIIGSGIFVSPIGVMKYTHSIGMAFVMWSVTGAFSILGALVYAELGVTIPRSGGEYTYILHSFGPLPAFLALWITFVAIGAASCAANSLVFADYVLSAFFPNCEVPRSAAHAVALFGLLTLCFINCYKVSWATKTAVVFTTCKILALLLIIGFGFAYLFMGNVQNFKNAFEGSNYSPTSLALAFYQGFWAFAGWNYLNFLTGEVKNPSRNMPIIIVLSLSLVTIIYLLANVAYLAILTTYDMLSGDGGSVAVAVLFAIRCMGVFAFVMPIFVGASVFGSVLGEMLSMSRLAYTAAEEGHMPALLSMVNIEKFTPIPSVLSVTILAILFQLYPNVQDLIELTGLAFTVISALAVGSLIQIRRKTPEMNKSAFRLPMIVPISYLIINCAIGILSIFDSWKKGVLSLLLMAAGIPIYVVFIAWNSKPSWFTSAYHSFTIFVQKLFAVVQPETQEEPVQNDSKAISIEEMDVWQSVPTP